MHCDAPCTGDFCQGQCDTQDWKRFEFRVNGCSVATSGLDVRSFTSVDGPGGAIGDLRVDLQTDVTLAALPLPGGPLRLDVLQACDRDGDDDCDLGDLAAIAAGFGTCELDPDFNEPADVDLDGCVTLADLETLAPDCSLLLADGSSLGIGLVSHQDLIAGAPADLELALGSLSDLRADGGFSRAACLGTLSNPALDPTGSPASGEGLYFVGRGTAGCSTYGDSSLDPDPRDALGSIPCP
jgi:hypothetical protein